MKLKKCKFCKTYTLVDICPKCGRPTANPHPPRFSPIDRFGPWRRKALKGQ